MFVTHGHMQSLLFQKPEGDSHSGDKDGKEDEDEEQDAEENNGQFTESH